MPINGTLTLIEAKTLASSAATVVFSAIPQTYTDLVLVVSARTDNAYIADTLYVTMNSSTSNFSWENIYTTGSGAVISQSNTNNQLASGINGASSTASTFSNVEIYIPNYRNTAHNKSITVQGVVENNATRGDDYVDTVLWNDTSSITSMTLSPIGAGVFVTNSTFYLYGIASAGASAKATGGTIYTDSTYFYHVFGSSGTFTPTQSISADILTVAGGGSGWGNGSVVGGGGGAGGLVYLASQSLTATGYGVTVGAGGAGSGSNGSNSQFASLTAAVGGGAGSNGGGNTGGSGGGGGDGGAGGDNTAGQGSNGGSGSAGFSGGGGGATVAGGNGSSPLGGNGGNGSSTYSSWGLATGTGQNASGIVYYAGGGGGSSPNHDTYGRAVGGLGGGGDGWGAGGGGTTGMANTGGGGGGTSANRNDGGKAGGSGIVIVRYAK